MNFNRAREYKVPILTYHSIDDSGSVISTSRETFRRQMRFLSEASFNVVSLNELANCIRDNRTLPANAIALTFDDGYQNIYTEAFPLLNQYGFTATVFLIADYCGKHNDWQGNLPLARQPLLAWREIEEMQRHNFEFGAHTLTHPDLTALSIQQIEREVCGSKKKIEDRLGAEVPLFAYPYGKYNGRIKEIVQQHFRAACATHLGKVGVGSDPFLLKRVDSYFVSSYKLFRQLPSAPLDWYLRFRETVRNLKNAL